MEAGNERSRNLGISERKNNRKSKNLGKNNMLSFFSGVFPFFPYKFNLVNTVYY